VQIDSESGRAMHIERVRVDAGDTGSDGSGD
jgi:hypothetical protein